MRSGRRVDGTGSPSAGRLIGDLKSISDHLGGEEQVVVVYNDQISWSVDFGDLVGEERVGFVVVEPERVGGRDGRGRVEPQEVMEQWPKRYLVSHIRLLAFVRSLVLQNPS